MPVRDIPAWTLAMRRWQADFFRSWVERRPQNDLLIATPGGGKTVGAARPLHACHRQGEVDLSIIVVPRQHLKLQFARALARVGLQFEPNFSNGAPELSADMHGMIVTYQQVAADPQLFRRLCNKHRAFVVLDEVHHASDESTWGEALFDAFEPAQYRLALSGTPWRSDGSRIPFITYDHNDDCVPGFAYTYEQAILDNVCRPLVFGVAKGKATWIAASDGKERTASFDDRLAKNLRAEQLRTYLMSDSFGEIIDQANSALMHVRDQGMRDAGALMVAIDQDHAKWLADLTHQTIGVRPDVVTSDDPNASKAIQQFERSRDPWLIAVHMVSEGVDIPRLRVGVFASNVRTPLYFRQFCGRFVRSNSGAQHLDDSYVFIPANPELVHNARTIKTEVAAAKKRKQQLDAELQLPSLPVERGESRYVAIGATVETGGSLHGNLPARATASPSAATEAPRMLADEKMTLRKRINAMVQKTAAQFRVPPGKVHGYLNSKFGKSLAAASIEQLNSRFATLKDWQTSGKYGGWS